jgi:predicted metalloprotease with PDZ domain
MADVVYRLLLAEPQTHHFLVDIEADGVTGPQRLVMPSWTPGSYLMREFPRNVVTFAAADGSGRPLAHAKTDKNTWQVDAPADGRLRARYLVYADELSVRTSHVDASHAFINGTSAFMYLEGRQDAEARLEVRAPQGWRITTALEETAPGAFRAESYDRLADAPLEIGTHDLFELEVDGVPHRWAVWGRGNLDRERLIADTARIVRAEKALFGELPYQRYTFILHLLPGGSGGLEHRDSTVLVADRFSFRGQAYEAFLGLVAHELFHAWNGKRIRPAVLGPFDYVRESYTRELWVVEGITTYYTDLILRRAGIIAPGRYLEKVAEQVTRLTTIPGRMVQPLEDASFDAWIKFYRPDANSPNATVSYYHKGGLVALLLDLKLREATGGERSLDDVMRALWAQYGRPDLGFPERRVEAVASEVAGVELTPFFDRWLRSTQELDFASALAAVGLALVPAHEPRPGAPAPPPPAGDPSAQPMREVKVGFQFKMEGGRTLVGNVMAGTPAWRAGVSPGDELVALDGLRVDAMSLGLRMQEKAPGTTAILTVFRRDELMNLAMQVESGPPTRLAIHPAPDATPEQQALLHHWLREDPPRDAG